MMKAVRSLWKYKANLLPALLLVLMAFLYGCQCEGGIGTVAGGSQPKSVAVQPGSK